MLKNYLFNVLIALALLIVVALTVREALATAGLSPETGVSTGAKTLCTSLPSRYSLHAEYVNGMWVPYTEDGPTGVDGGLKELMTAYRTCSR